MSLINKDFVWDTVNNVLENYQYYDGKTERDLTEEEKVLFQDIFDRVMDELTDNM